MTVNRGVIKKIINNQEARIRLARESHRWFFAMYFPHYITYETAPFHDELFAITQDNSIGLAIITAFRGSGKSTIMIFSYPIWAIIGKSKSRFITLISQTQHQSRSALENIKKELETNELLMNDFGPFLTQDGDWRAETIDIQRYEARVTALSRGESVRGLRHMQYRPDLIVVDDFEDLESVKTKEGRDATFNWLVGDIFPMGHLGTKKIVIGNYLHKDSTIMRLQNSIKAGDRSGIYRCYPLIDENNRILWPGKYPTMEAIKKEKAGIGDLLTWHREFLLELLSDADQVVLHEWIQYYNHLPQPEDHADFRGFMTAIDPAFSQEDHADNIAMVSGMVFGYGKNLRVYILPHPVNQKMTYPQALEKAMGISVNLGSGQKTKLIVEGGSTQLSLAQSLLDEGYPAEVFKPGSRDKRERLALTSHLIQQGRIMFPRLGAEELVGQIIGYGIERYDDLLDAFTTLILKLTEEKKPNMPMIAKGGQSLYDSRIRRLTFLR